MELFVVLKANGELGKWIDDSIKSIQNKEVIVIKIDGNDDIELKSEIEFRNFLISEGVAF